MKKITIFAAAIALLSATSVSCSSSEKGDSTTDANTETNTEATVEETATTVDVQGVIDLKDDNKFRPNQKVDQVTVLDFNAVWCVPCKKLTPALHLAADSIKDVAFYSVDIDSLPATKAAFAVENVPTVVILTPNGETKRVEGLGDFLKGANTDTDTDLTPIIYANLKEMVK